MRIGPQTKLWPSLKTKILETFLSIFLQFNPLVTTTCLLPFDKLQLQSGLLSITLQSLCFLKPAHLYNLIMLQMSYSDITEH